MCGISGFWQPVGANEAALDAAARVMGAAIRHRGPDADGTFCRADQGLALVHRRLAILDLSPAGEQPMRSASGRYLIVFNGEIYNHLALRAQLSHQQWRGHSDTETLLAAIDQWGIETALQHAVGMFALALWDEHEHALWLARDRLGEKPLYFGWCGATLLFGSELGALAAHPHFDAAVDPNALALLMRHNYIPAPYSVYRDIGKLPPGTTLKVRSHDDRSARPRVYWSPSKVADAAAANRFTGSDDEAVDRLESLLGEAVALQSVADVPLGAFLSGGIDSSTVVALMQRHSPGRVRTYSIGFDDPAFDESAHAAAVARHLGTDHTEWIVTAADALAVVDRLPSMFSEPFSDSSQIPTYLVAQMARQHVTVALSGDAGDELFGGYTRYGVTQRLWARLGRAGKGPRRVLARMLEAVPLESWDRLAAVVPGVAYRKAGQQAHRLAEMLAAADGEDFYRLMVSHESHPERIVRGSAEPATLLTRRDAWPTLDSLVERMMYLDAVTYLPDDILAKVDRTAMAVSLETRVPMLDHRVVEFAWSLPLHLKCRHGHGKWLLRQLLFRYVPRELVERPKAGFAVPLANWLRGPLRDWAAALLDERLLREQGYFEPATVRLLWEQHLQGQRDWQYRLWNILMFQAWLENTRRAS
jgi:asparagine synthase (glutamine-hydrolysing)